MTLLLYTDLDTEHKNLAKQADCLNTASILMKFATFYLYILVDKVGERPFVKEITLVINRKD